MTDTPDPIPTPDPKSKTPNAADDKRAVWARGGWMLVLLILFSMAQMLLVATAIFQFGWMLFTRKKNPNITDFGTKLGNWMAKTARFQAVASEEKPFPWSAWE